MKKIPTIFDRNWEGDKTVIEKYVQSFNFTGAVATEKIDGMNVRLTIRNNTVVRIEKRRNPDKRQKAEGIFEPWYVDTDEYGPEDKHLIAAVRNRVYPGVQDGEWSGEAVGPNIQGNPLNLERTTVCLFSCGEAPVFENVPTTYEGLKAWLPCAESKFGKGIIEGIVWHWPDGSMAKIKRRDFVPDNR